jgi:hypothetical protein
VKDRAIIIYGWTISAASLETSELLDYAGNSYRPVRCRICRCQNGSIALPPISAAGEVDCISYFFWKTFIAAHIQDVFTLFRGNINKNK